MNFIAYLIANHVEEGKEKEKEKEDGAFHQKVETHAMEVAARWKRIGPLMMTSG